MSTTPRPAGVAGTGSGWALRRQILALAVPVMMEQLLTTLTSIVDMIMVGHLGPAPVAAVGLSHMPLMLSMVVFMGIGTGGTALVARYTGAQDPETVESVTRQSFWMGLVSAVLVAAGYYTAAPAIMALMGAEPEVAPLGVAYLRWSAIGFVAMQWAQVMSGAVRGRGDTVTPLYIGAGVNAVNLFLDYVLIYGHLGFPALGLIGAALGTTIARVLGAVALLLYLGRSRHPVRLRLATLFQLDPSVMWRILRIGLPTSGERALNTLGQITYVRIVAGLGTVAVAAHQITLNAESISYMPAIGLATAGTALVGQQLGAGDAPGAERVTWETIRISVAIMAVMSLIFIFLGRPYIGLYTSDPAVQHLAVRMLAIAGLVQIPMGITFTLFGALRGAGDTLPVMAATAVGVWGVRLVVTSALILGAGWGLEGAWTSTLFDWAFRMTAGWWRFRSGAWRTMRV